MVEVIPTKKASFLFVFELGRIHEYENFHWHLRYTGQAYCLALIFQKVFGSDQSYALVCMGKGIKEADVDVMKAMIKRKCRYQYVKYACTNNAVDTYE